MRYDHPLGYSHFESSQVRGLLRNRQPAPLAGCPSPSVPSQADVEPRQPTGHYGFQNAQRIRAIAHDQARFFSLCGNSATLIESGVGQANLAPRRRFKQGNNWVSTAFTMSRNATGLNREETTGLEANRERMKAVIYVFIWALGTAALPVLLTPPRSDDGAHANLGATPLSPTSTLDKPPPEPRRPAPEVVPQALLQQTVDRAVRVTSVAMATARDYAALDRSRHALDEAANLVRRVPARSLALVERVLEVPQDGAIRDRAWWLMGDALAALGDPAGALTAWEQLDAVSVPDYLALRRAEAQLALGNTHQAAEQALALTETLRHTGHQTLHYARQLRLQALYAAGRWSELVDEGEAFLNRYREYPRTDQLWHQLGQAQIALGQPERAARHFDAVVWNYPYRPTAQASLLALRTLGAAGVRLPAHSFNERFEQARRHRVNKHWDIVDALLEDLLSDVLAEQGETGFANEIRMARWRNSYGSGDFPAALDHLEQIQSAGRRGVRGGQFFTRLSDTYARLGQIEQGAEALRRRDRGRSEVHRHNQLGAFYYENGYYNEALQHHRQVLTERRQANWSFSRLLFMAGEYRRAGRQFEALGDRSVGSNRRRFRYWEGRSWQQAGWHDAARRSFEQVLESGARTYYGLQASNRLLELDRSEPPELFVDVDSIDTTATDASLGTGSQTLDDLAGRVLQDLNLDLTELVLRAVEQPVVASDAGPNASFHRAARLYWDGPDGVPDTQLALLASEHRIESAYWQSPDEGALGQLAEEYGDLFEALERSRFLYSVGRRHDARVEARDASIEFRALDSRFSRRRPTRLRPIALGQRRFAHYIDNRSEDTGFWGIRLNNYRYPVPEVSAERVSLGERQVAIYDNRSELRESFRQGLMQLGDYHLVRRFARERGGWRRTPENGQNRQDWSEAYPRAYTDLVTEFAAEYGLNPYVIWALMTVESSHNPDSISRANARGLLQVIPKTGELISQRLGYWDFGPHNLMTPELSIEFGCYYFSELMTKFHGQELLAFAAYNGGPHRVARLLEGHGRLPLDAFIEAIPYEQAREYTKKVYRHLALYRRLYLGEEQLYVGQAIDPDYENNIHF